MSRPVHIPKPAGRRTGVVTLLACLLPGIAIAAPQTSLVASLEARASDNVLRAPDGDRNDVVYTPEVRFSLGDRGERFEISSDYRYQRRYFQRGSFSDDQVLTGSSRIALDVIEDRYRWILGHTRTQALQQPTIVDVPDNQFEFDTLSFGQEFKLLSTARQQGTLDFTIAEQRGAREQDASLRYTAGARFNHELSERQTVGLSADWLEVDYDASFLPTFERRSVLLETSRRGRAWEMTLDAGYNWLDRDGQEGTGGLALDGQFSWTLTNRQTLTAQISRRITDQAALAPVGIPDLEGTIQEAEFDGQVFEDTSFAVTYRYAGDRLDLRLTGSRGQQTFDNTGQEQERIVLRGDADYRLTRRLALTANLSRSEIEFSGAPGAGTDRTDELLGVRMGGRWSFGPRTDVTMEARYDERETDPTSIAVFDERSLVMSIRRTFL